MCAIQPWVCSIMGVEELLERRVIKMGFVHDWGLGMSPRVLRKTYEDVSNNWVEKLMLLLVAYFAESVIVVSCLASVRA